MINQLKLGLAALVLSSCATYKTISYDKQIIGRVIHKSDTAKYELYNGHTDKYVIHVMALLQHKDFTIREYADKDTYCSVEQDSIVQLDIRQLCNIKYNKKGNIIDTVGIANGLIIKNISRTDQTLENEKKFNGLNFRTYDLYRNGHYAPESTYGQYLSQSEKRLRKKNKNTKK